jgi:uncharacterized protein YecT (DUF1311 family)
LDKTGIYSAPSIKNALNNPATLIPECLTAWELRQSDRTKELKPDRRKELQEAQRLWIKYTEANCNFYLDPEGGTAAKLAASECQVRAKAARAKELENLLQ